MDFISNPENRKPLEYLSARNPTAPLFAGPDSARNPYFELGSHPEVVERLWKELAKSLPLDCRCIVCGTPALVQPETGILLAFALGTQYLLHLPFEVAEEAIRAGAPLRVEWAGGKTTDSRHELGVNWVFGRFLPQETGWMDKSYNEFGDPKYQPF